MPEVADVCAKKDPPTNTTNITIQARLRDFIGLHRFRKTIRLQNLVFKKERYRPLRRIIQTLHARSSATVAAITLAADDHPRLIAPSSADTEDFWPLPLTGSVPHISAT